VSAALNRDYTLVLGTVLLYAALLLAFNAAADMAAAWLDPRAAGVAGRA
jgi:oligopeptide transport system permease protein